MQEQRYTLAAAALTASLDLTQVLERLFSQLEEVVPYDSVTVFLIEDEALVAVAGHGLPHPEAVLGRRFQKSNALFEAMSELRTPLILADAQLDPRRRRLGRTNAGRCTRPFLRPAKGS